MKYIDAEKLIAEIDSILSGCTKQTHTGVYNTCHRIKGIIASLQQEKPEVDLPKWKKTKPERGNAFGKGAWYASGIAQNNGKHTIFINGYEISVDELFDKLPKEE